MRCLPNHSFEWTCEKVKLLGPEHSGERWRLGRASGVRTWRILFVFYLYFHPKIFVFSHSRHFPAVFSIWFHPFSVFTCQPLPVRSCLSKLSYPFYNVVSPPPRSIFLLLHHHFISAQMECGYTSLSDMARPPPVLQQGNSHCNYSTNIHREGHIPAASLVLPVLMYDRASNRYLVSLNEELRRIDEQRGFVLWF